MLKSDYFESLATELDALKNRVRNFIQNRHWLTDGEWKESVLRTFLRRSLPKSVQIGKGFVITEKDISKQIDILIYDSTKPLFFQEGDLVFAPPDAVLGVIEVKTSLNKALLKKTINELCSTSELIEKWYPQSNRVFGLFSYEDNTRSMSDTLSMIKSAVNGDGSRIIDLICLGESRFIKFWEIDPYNKKRLIDTWHAYDLERKAAGYFIHNVIEGICSYSVSQHQKIWFPREGKEMNKIGEISLK